MKIDWLNSIIKIKFFYRLKHIVKKIKISHQVKKYSQYKYLKINIQNM